VNRVPIGLFVIGAIASVFASAAVIPAGKTDVLVSPEQQTADGTWRYAVRRSTNTWECGTRENRLDCVEQSVYIENESKLTLECFVQVDYRNAEGRIVSSFGTPALVMPGTSPRVHFQTTAAILALEANKVDCKARAPYQRVTKTAGCSYRMYGDMLESYYPASAMRESLEGPVIVAFGLDRKRGTAQQVRVVESSLVPQLDAAALRFISEQRFETNCPGTQFDVLVRFRLRDQVLARRE
jgi:TonB family protein